MKERMTVQLTFTDLSSDDVNTVKTPRIEEVSAVILLDGNLPRIVYTAGRLEHPVKPADAASGDTVEEKLSRQEDLYLEFLQKLLDAAKVQVQRRRDKRAKEEERRKMESLEGYLPKPGPGLDFELEFEDDDL